MNNFMKNIKIFHLLLFIITLFTNNHFHAMNNQKISAQQFVCMPCNRIFSHASNYARHTQSQLHSITITSCTEYNKLLSDTHYSKQHKKTYTRKKSYACATCDKSFIHSFALTEHIRIHTGERPYQCSLCNTNYIHYDSYRKHQNTLGHLRALAVDKNIDKNGADESYAPESSYESSHETSSSDEDSEGNVIYKQFTQSINTCDSLLESHYNESILIVPTFK